MKIRKILLLTITLLSITAWGPFSFFATSSTTNPIGDSSPSVNTSSPHSNSSNSSDWINKQSKIILAQANNLDPKVLKVGLTAYCKARAKGMDPKQVLTIVDYSKPSNKRRLWVVNLRTDKVLFNTWVAHGKNSGGVDSTSFSNDPRSLKSSLGVFLTGDSYVGHDGYSLRVQGLEPGFNSNAYRRDIVFHGAWYASQEIAKTRGALGRSWGCLAVGEQTIHPLVNTIKDDTLVVAYYPDRNWLRHSAYLT